MALAGLAGCTKQPDEPIYPYVKQPEDLILGKPMYFATAHPFTTGAVPLLVKSDEFRPIKVDGNPEHPYNQGSSDPYYAGHAAGSLRSRPLAARDSIAARTASGRSLPRRFALKVAATKDGTGIYFLSATITSPTLARQWKAVQAAYPKAKLVQYDPALAGTAAGRRGSNVQYALERRGRDCFARRGLFVGRELSRLSQAGARVRGAAQGARTQLNRLYAVESTPTTTGMKAEHRLGLRASEIPAFAAAAGEGSGRGGRQRAGLCVDRRAAEVSRRAGQGPEGQRRQERGDSGAVSGCSRSRSWRSPSTTRWAMSARRSVCVRAAESAAQRSDSPTSRRWSPI